MTISQCIGDYNIYVVYKKTNDNGFDNYGIASIPFTISSFNNSVYCQILRDIEFSMSLYEGQTAQIYIVKIKIIEGDWEYEGWINTHIGRVQIGTSSDPDKKKSLKFYGMSSEEAMEAHNGGVGTYRTSEGKSESVAYKGSVMDVMQEITGGLRSACAYVGARTLKDFPKCATFVRTNRVHH